MVVTNGPDDTASASTEDQAASGKVSLAASAADSDANVAALRERSLASRILWAALGLLAVALAALGVVLPGLPTTPFLILAAACFARSSRRLYDRLLGSRTFGPLIRQYRAGRGVPRRAKRMALVLMTVFVLFALGPGMPEAWFWPRVAVLSVGLIGAVYLARLPTWDGPLETSEGPSNGS